MKFWALLFIVFSSVVHAEDLADIRSPKIQGNTLTIAGRIDSHIYDFLSYAGEALKKVEVVELNSFGGSLDWGLDIAQKLKAMNIRTKLSSGNVCASTCVFLFAAGRVREADSDTWLGIHGGRFKDLKNLQLALDVTDRAFTFLEENGVYPSLREVYFSFPDEDDWEENGNATRKRDWVLPSFDASIFNLVTRLNVVPGDSQDQNGPL